MPVFPSPRARQFRDLVEKGDQQGFEDLWLEALETAPADVGAFLAGIDALASQGAFDKAGLYLSMLSPVLLEQGLYAEALQVLRTMAEVAPRERGLRHGLLTAYRNLYADDPRLETWIRASGLGEGKDLRDAMQKMETWLGFKEGRYVFHPGGWGTGKVVAVDAEDGSVVIDFEVKKGHRISVDMAARKTEFVEDDDLRAMRLDRIDDLRRLMEDDAVELIRCALRSRRGKSNLREIRDRLAGDASKGDVMDQKAWSRWWQKTRPLVKTAADISITPGSNPTLELAEETGGYPESCARDLAHLSTDARKVRYLRDLLKEAADHEDGAEAVQAVADRLLGPQGDASGLDPGPRISLGFLLVEARRVFPSLEVPDAFQVERLIAGEEHLLQVLPDIPISGHRLAALRTMKERQDVDWPRLCARVILRGESDTADHGLRELKSLGKQTLLDETLDTVLDRYREYPDAFVWYLKSRRAGRIPDGVRQESDPVLLEKTLVLHGHLDVAALGDDAAAERARPLSKDLARVLAHQNHGLVRDAFSHATTAEAGNLTALLRNNRSLKVDLRDRMMAEMFRTRPEAAKMAPRADAVEGTDPVIDPNALFCTERALLAKRHEYEDLVNRQIPENSAEIGRAASHGDLSENAEWTAAIEKQERLSHAAEELREGLAKARLITPRTQEDDDGRVGLGSRVTVRDVAGKVHAYTILGPWDVDSTRGFISYLSPLGRALLGKQPADPVAVTVPSGTLQYTVEEVTDGLADAEQPRRDPGEHRQSSAS